MRRTRTGVTIGDFYCRLGRHSTLAGAFERDNRNLGACIECAFGMFDVLQEYYPVWASLNQDIEEKIAEVAESRSHRSQIAQLSRGSNEPGWVYYVEQAELIKIGYSVKPAERMKAYGPTAKLLAIHPGTLALERETHQRFRRHLARGREWFSRDPELLEHIAAVRGKFGDPSVFAHSFTIPIDKRGSGVSPLKGRARFQIIR